MGLSEMMTYLLAFLVIVIVVMLILREFTCWYWKINEIVSLLKDLNERLNSLGTKPTTSIMAKEDTQENSKMRNIEATEDQKREEKEEAEKLWQEYKKKRDDDLLKYR